MLSKQQEYQLSELNSPEPETETFYQKEIVVTTILMAGTTKLTRQFIDVVKKHFVFKGNEKFANAKIFGTVTIYQPDTIFDFPSVKFFIEKKNIGDREFWRIWFSPSDLSIITAPLSVVVKKWCEFRHVNIDCNVTQEILQSIKE